MTQRLHASSTSVNAWQSAAAGRAPARRAAARRRVCASAHLCRLYEHSHIGWRLLEHHAQAVGKANDNGVVVLARGVNELVDGGDAAQLLVHVVAHGEVEQAPSQLLHVGLKRLTCHLARLHLHLQAKRARSPRAHGLIFVPQLLHQRRRAVCHGAGWAALGSSDGCGRRHGPLHLVKAPTPQEAPAAHSQDAHAAASPGGVVVVDWLDNWQWRKWRRATILLISACRAAIKQQQCKLHTILSSIVH